MSVCGYICIIWRFTVQKIRLVSVLSKKTTAVCGLGRTNYGSLRNVPPPIIDPLKILSIHTSSENYKNYIRTNYKSRHFYHTWQLDITPRYEENACVRERKKKTSEHFTVSRHFKYFRIYTEKRWRPEKKTRLSK